jgi:hypothetical protein
MARALGLIALLLVLILLVAYLTWLFSMIAAFIWQGWVSAGKPGIWQILKNMYMAPWEGSEAVAKGPGQVQRVIVQQPMQTPSLKEPVGTVCKGVAAGERGFDCGVALSALNTVLLVWILVWYVLYSCVKCDAFARMEH